jgi:diguanylate cyclase (GGDEF)-like protein
MLKPRPGRSDHGCRDTDVRRLRRHLLFSALAALAALPAVGAPAHAVGANVTLPQTPVPLPQTQITVTAPGTNVNVGPGGANVSIDPQRAIGGITGGGSQPGAPPAAGSPSTPSSPATPSQQSGSGAGGGSPARDTAGAPVKGGPATRTGSGRDAAPAGGTLAGTKGGQAASAAIRESRSLASARRRIDTRTAAARGASGEPNPVRQIIEKIPTELLAALLATALLAAAMSLVWLRERGRVRAAQRKAEVDSLTGIPNRFAFDQRLANEWKRARRYGRPLGLLLLDLDGLKRVNDKDGHEAGDRMIKKAAAQISADTRQSDLAARLAGDEFVVLCPETSRAGLEQLATKLAERLEHGGIAASLGWAELSDTDGPGDLLARADAAMYQEKARRRTATPIATARPGFAIAG